MQVQETSRKQQSWQVLHWVHKLSSGMLKGKNQQQANQAWKEVNRKHLKWEKPNWNIYHLIISL